MLTGDTMRAVGTQILTTTMGLGIVTAVLASSLSGQTVGCQLSNTALNGPPATTAACSGGRTDMRTSSARSKLFAGGTCLAFALTVGLFVPLRSNGTSQHADVFLIPGGPGDSGALLATSLEGLEEFNGVDVSPNPDFTESSVACDEAAPNDSLTWNGELVSEFENLLAVCMRSIERAYSANRQLRDEAYKKWSDSHPEGVVLAISYGYNLIPSNSNRSVAVSPQIRPVDPADFASYRSSFDGSLATIISRCRNQCGPVEEIDWSSIGWLTQTALAQALLDPDKFRPLIESSLRKIGSGATTRDLTLQLAVLGPEPRFLLATAIRCLDGWPSAQPELGNTFGSNVVKMLSLCPKQGKTKDTNRGNVQPLVVRGRSDPYPSEGEAFRVVVGAHDVLATKVGRRAVVSAIHATNPEQLLPLRRTIIWTNVIWTALAGILMVVLVWRCLRWTVRFHQRITKDT